jgi:hypothetical protein
MSSRLKAWQQFSVWAYERVQFGFGESFFPKTLNIGERLVKEAGFLAGWRRIEQGFGHSSAPKAYLSRGERLAREDGIMAGCSSGGDR